MENEIVSYLEMCQREGLSLQRGMNFARRGGYSVVLMSQRPNAPYIDRIKDDGATLIYEGHDVPRSSAVPDPKRVDQPEFTPAGALTENGKFLRAALQGRQGGATHPVKVYEKIRQGIWSYNGVFHLIDAWQERDELRSVFRFKLVAVYLRSESSQQKIIDNAVRRRIIPTDVKIEVWKRDRGKCVLCGSSEELHFDHDLPYVLGGTSVRPENVQLLCARHNLSKGAKIR